MEWLKKLRSKSAVERRDCGGTCDNALQRLQPKSEGILIGLGIFGLGVGEHMNHHKIMEWVNGGTSHIFSSRQPADGF